MGQMGLTLGRWVPCEAGLEQRERVTERLAAVF